jgi:uncharacterized protein (DUF169 family)
MNPSATAALLTAELDLDIVPVALACVDSPPAGVRVMEEVKPSACSLWREAEKGLFYAPAASHFNCPVGAMVMGFELPQAVSAELMQLVGTMTQCGYIAAEEPGKIPTHARKGAKGVLYGPLAAFPLAPDALLLWLTPAQAMIAAEGIGGAAWGTDTPATVYGRPACAAIPQALQASRPTLSLGCMGMRTFTGIGAERMLAVVPGSAIESFAQAVERSSAVNAGMGAFYRNRAAALAG